MIEPAIDVIVRNFQNHTIEIHCKKLVIPISQILPYLDKNEFNAYCKNGCPNHKEKWTCPPNCPDFEDYAKSFSEVQLYLFHTSTHQFSFLPKENRSLEAYNFSKEELQSFLRDNEPKNGRMIAANSCEICSPCALSLGKKCYFPGKLRYNLVAFGFNVGAIMTELFQHQLQWASDGEIPEYVSSVGAILK